MEKIYKRPGKYSQHELVDRLHFILPILRAEGLIKNRRDFMQQMGISKGTQVCYFSGRQVPSLDFINRLHEVFGVSLEWMLKGREPILLQRKATLFTDKEAAREFVEMTQEDAEMGKQCTPVVVKTMDGTKPEYVAASKRLSEILVYLNASYASLSRFIGDEAPARLMYIAKARNGFSADVASKIVRRCPQLSYVWILKGEGPMLVDEYSPEQELLISTLGPTIDSMDIDGLLEQYKATYGELIQGTGIPRALLNAWRLGVGGPSEATKTKIMRFFSDHAAKNGIEASDVAEVTPRERMAMQNTRIAALEAEVETLKAALSATSEANRKMAELIAKR